jgi:hypothetical protein
MKHPIRPCLAWLPMLAVGCGGPGEVAGTVTFNGKPVVVGYVVAIGSNSAVYVSGELNESGGYCIPSVPSGRAVFAVHSRGPATARKSVERENAARGRTLLTSTVNKKWFSIGDQFCDPSTAGLSYDVRTGANRYDIALVSPKK